MGWVQLLSPFTDEAMIQSSLAPYLRFYSWLVVMPEMVFKSDVKKNQLLHL